MKMQNITRRDFIATGAAVAAAWVPALGTSIKQTKKELL
ncbi:MAG: twin-arginine translocation signal domain-containing protein [Flammeovirgaceae bacterium]|nr:twin-arginine translocation signal domain-containing protein [Flammeovirgaceae bacterium]